MRRLLVIVTGALLILTGGGCVVQLVREGAVRSWSAPDLPILVISLLAIGAGIVALRGE